MPQLTTAELRVTKVQAQAVLTEEAEAARRRLAGEDAQRREAERLERQAAEERVAAAAYFDAVGAYERQIKQAFETEAEIYERAKEWLGVRGDNDPVGNSKLRVGPTGKRLSRYLSLVLAKSPGQSVGRYGDIRLLNFHSRFGIWVAGERREFGEKENQKDD